MFLMGITPRELAAVLGRLEHAFRQSRRLATDVQRWSGTGSRPYITETRRDSIVELAFLRSYLAWERFLEESFILYLLGKRAPRGRQPRRFAMPPDAKTAREFVQGGREYAKWDGAATLDRAKVFFRAGRPYANAIEPRRHLLREVQIVRNAIAHQSETARRKFEKLVRDKCGTLPPKTTVGKFLTTTVSGSNPAKSFFELYLDEVVMVAREIVPI